MFVGQDGSDESSSVVTSQSDEHQTVRVDLYLASARVVGDVVSKETHPVQALTSPALSSPSSSSEDLVKVAVSAAVKHSLHQIRFCACVEDAK